MTTWATLKTEIQTEINEADFNSGGSAEDQLLVWANRVQLDIARILPVQYLLQTDQATIDTSNYQWTLPPDFMKVDQLRTKVRVADEYVDIVDIDVLNAKDPNHSEISSDSTPDCVAIEGTFLYVYPLWAGTIVLENYYRNPTDMVNTTDSPDLPKLPDDLMVQGVLQYAYKWNNEPELEAESKAIFEQKLSDYAYYLRRTQFRYRTLTGQYY